MNSGGRGLLLHEFIRSGSPREVYDFLKNHPGLISEASLDAMRQMEAAASRGGHDDAALLISRRRERVERCIATGGVDESYAEEGLTWMCLPDPALVPLADTVVNSCIAYAQSNAISDLDNAIDTAVSILEHAAFRETEGGLRAAVYFDTGSLFWYRQQSSGAPRDISEAAALWKRALEVAGPAHPEYVRYLGHYIEALVGNMQQAGGRSSLDEAISLAEDALRQLSSAGTSQSPELLHALGRARRERARHTGNAADLDRAISAAEAALRHTPPDKPEYARTRQLLGSAQHDRYLRTGNLVDLETALEVFNEAVTSGPGTPEGPYSLALDLNSLANALRDRYHRTGDMQSLDSAIDARRKSVAMTTERDPNYVYYLANLGNNLRDRYLETKNGADLDEAIASYEAAMQIGARSIDFGAVCVMGFAAVLRTRFAAEQQEADLERAIEMYESLDVQFEPDSPMRYSLLSSWGNALADRSRSFGTNDDARRARELFQAVLRSATVPPEGAVLAARNWIAMAIGNMDWPAVAEASLAGLDAIDGLVGSQLTRRQKEAWLRDARDVSSAAAFALAKVGRLPEAVTALEGGRARLLSDALELEGSKLAGLERAGQSDLAERYRNSAARLQQLGFESDRLSVGPAHRLATATEQRRALADFEEALKEVRLVPGFSDFRTGPSADDIYNAATGAPIIYITATKMGGQALIVSGQPETVQCVWLPLLSHDKLMQKLDPYIDGFTDGSLGADPAILDDVCQWLWRVMADPIIAALPSTPEIVLVPTGWLALLPLHAAWRADPSTATGRHYLIDQYKVTYAANARARLTANHRAARLQVRSSFVVEDPRPTSAERLDYAENEANAVLKSIPGARLRHEAATKAHVRPALREHSVLHFACHGSASPGSPLTSRLILADDEALTLAELMTDHLNGARLVVLSACETAVVGGMLLDEVVNFPTGVLQAGAAGCIGSLWSVPDVATALLMQRFYELWPGKNTDPGEALRRAQQWIRDTSNGELVDGAYLSAPHAKGLTAQQWESWREARSYSHPFCWAGFGFYGA